jgi:predicted aspartyl protease
MSLFVRAMGRIVRMRTVPKHLFACLCATLALLAPLAHGADAPRCTYVEIATLPIRYAGPGLTPAVDGSIDDVPATMLVDTGAFDTLLTMTGVAKRNLPLHMTGRYVNGISGFSRMYVTRLKEFGIGPTRTTRRIDLPVVYETAFTPAFDAILGSPFLLQRDLEFDLGAKKIRFFQPENCKGVALQIWKEEALSVPFERSWDRSPNPHFTALVNGKEVDAMIDTGAHRSFLQRSAAKKVGIDVDGPGVTRMGEVGGIGSDRAPRWIAPVKQLQIGDETINDAEIGVIESQGSNGAELYLGQDFLRSHRVLFAMSQRKLYFAYTGGNVFTRGTGLEPWMRQEADGGNADAQYALSTMYGAGRGGVARDPLVAQVWLDMAAAAGQPHANLMLGRRRLLSGQAADAIPLLRKALDQLPAERYGALWLYTARVQGGDAALARSELEASLERQHDDNWPEPLGRFYLGKIDAARLLDEAGRDKDGAARRRCEAEGYMGEWYRAQGDTGNADALRAEARAHCAAPARSAPAAADAAKTAAGAP